MSNARQFTSLEEVRRCVPVVAVALRDIPSSEIPNAAAIAICALATCNEALVERVMKLESIAPKKITSPCGAVFVWHCPSHLIPEVGTSEVKSAYQRGLIRGANSNAE